MYIWKVFTLPTQTQTRFFWHFSKQPWGLKHQISFFKQLWRGRFLGMLQQRFWNLVDKQFQLQEVKVFHAVHLSIDLEHWQTPGWVAVDHGDPWWEYAPRAFNPHLPSRGHEIIGDPGRGIRDLKMFGVWNEWIIMVKPQVHIDGQNSIPPCY